MSDTRKFLCKWNSAKKWLITRHVTAKSKKCRNQRIFMTKLACLTKWNTVLDKISLFQYLNAKIENYEFLVLPVHRAGCRARGSRVPSRRYRFGLRLVRRGWKCTLSYFLIYGVCKVRMKMMKKCRAPSFYTPSILETFEKTAQRAFIWKLVRSHEIKAHTQKNNRKSEILIYS